jgi:membrane-bound metal-dependent hydrolase YbcI (DUF457 family)
MAFMCLAILGAYFVLFTIFKPRHRGITHTLVAGGVFSVLIFLLAGTLAGIVAGVGYLSHLVADSHVKMI